MDVSKVTKALTTIIGIDLAYGQIRFIKTAKTVSDKTRISPKVIKTFSTESLGLRPVMAS